MPVITYTAVNRGYLKGGHSAGTSYKIETNFDSFPREFVFKGAKDEALDGTPEGWLQAIQRQWEIQTDLVLKAAAADWIEFFTSVASAETFQVDFTGTIASPGTNVSVWFPAANVPEPHVYGVGYKYSFRVKAVP
jgi:hypothetical protein